MFVRLELQILANQVVLRQELQGLQLQRFILKKEEVMADFIF